jgi:hypothetical protein
MTSSMERKKHGGRAYTGKLFISWQAGSRDRHE